MTRDDVIRMAREAGLVGGPVYAKGLEAFAALVEDSATAAANVRANTSWSLMCEKMVAAEREACERAIEELMPDASRSDCAAAIRARSEI
jgi:hypothetical protein